MRSIGTATSLCTSTLEGCRVVNDLDWDSAGAVDVVALLSLCSSQSTTAAEPPLSPYWTNLLCGAPFGE